MIIFFGSCFSFSAEKYSVNLNDWPADIAEKISKAATGYRHTENAKLKMSISRLGMQNTLGHKHSDATKQKMSDAHIGNKSRLGQTRSTEEKEKQSKSMQGRSQSIFTCPHCQNTGGNAMKRWHFDNCKGKT